MENLKEVGSYDEFRNNIAEVKDSCNFLPDVTTEEGYQKSKRVSLDVGKLLTAVESKRKDLKAESLAKGRSIDQEAKAIVAELSAFQIPHKNAYKELDALKKEREQRRKDELDSRVMHIKSLPDLMADADSDAIAAALEEVKSEDCLDFYEFTENALKARNDSIEALAKLYADTLKAESDAKELAELRIKQEKQDQLDREKKVADAAKKEAEDKAKEKADKVERLRVEAEEKAKAEIDLVEKAKKLAEDKAEASAKAEKDAVEAKFQAEKQAKIDAKKTADKAKQDGLDAAENAKQEQIRKQEAKEANEKLEKDKREANKRHVGSVRKAAKESFVNSGLSEAKSKELVMAIHNKEIKNISITY